MSHFCLLKNPKNYVAHDWDLVSDNGAREHWLDLFSKHFEQTLAHAAVKYGRTAKKQIDAARQQFTLVLRQLGENPASLDHGRLDIIELCRLREKALRDNKLNDPFGHIKHRENNAAQELYPQVVKQLHAMQGRDKWLHLIECVFAGNIFDLGSPMTMNLADEPPDFIALAETIKPRPWLFDDFDRLAQDLPDKPPTAWSKAVALVDNAGCDFILGVMPLLRELAMFGTKIVIAANELPSLNDITVDETIEVMQHLAGVDPDMEVLVKAGMFEVVSSGNDIPLIDLAEVSDELNEASADADLLIIEGMGRAVESNLHAEFTVDTLNLALIKDPEVAKRVGGEVFDCVCKYTPKS